MTMKCRDCKWCEPTGKGTHQTTNGIVNVDIGACHGDVPKLTITNQGVWPPVALDIDWCAKFVKA